MHFDSKNVTSEQTEPHKDLLKLIQRYKVSEYLRPIEAELERKIFKEVAKSKEFKGIILDSCCGVGESTYHLAQAHPHHLILGVDKSQSRIERKNSFKNRGCQNVLLVQGNILDYWCFLYKHKKEFPVAKVFLLFPNPYPKASQMKKRWHAQPAFQWVIGLDCEIELRTNWKIYRDEFELATKTYGHRILELGQYVPETVITPFERKYLESGHALYSCISAPLIHSHERMFDGK